MSDAVVIDAATGEVLLSQQEALALTAKIKGYTAELWRLLKQAHDGQAWRALEYSSWRRYIEDEFDLHKSQAYRLLSHANAVYALDDAAGLDHEVSPMGDTFGERATRNLDVPAATEAVREAVRDLPPEATAERARAAAAAVRDLPPKPSTPPIPSGSGVEADATGASAAESVTAAPFGGEPPSRPVAVSDDTERAARVAAASVAIAKAHPLLDIEPDALVALADPAQRELWLGFVDDLADWCHRVDRAARQANHLRSVP